MKEQKIYLKRGLSLFLSLALILSYSSVPMTFAADPAALLGDPANPDQRPACDPNAENCNQNPSQTVQQPANTSQDFLSTGPLSVSNPNTDTNKTSTAEGLTDAEKNSITQDARSFVMVMKALNSIQRHAAGIEDSITLKQYQQYMILNKTDSASREVLPTGALTNSVAARAKAVIKIVSHSLATPPATNHDGPLSSNPPPADQDPISQLGRAVKTFGDDLMRLFHDEYGNMKTKSYRDKLDRISKELDEYTKTEGDTSDELGEKIKFFQWEKLAFADPMTEMLTDDNKILTAKKNKQADGTVTEEYFADFNQVKPILALLNPSGYFHPFLKVLMMNLVSPDQIRQVLAAKIAREFLLKKLKTLAQECKEGKKKVELIYNGKKQANPFILALQEGGLYQLIITTVTTNLINGGDNSAVPSGSESK